jgi:hypothetical protein
MIGGRLNATLFFREGAENDARGGRAPQQLLPIVGLTFNL